MNNAVKSALFSALLLPGWGQFYLKFYKRGLLFLLPTLWGLLAIAWMIIDAGMTAVKILSFPKGSFQISYVFLTLAESFKLINLLHLLLILVLALVLWLLSVLDAYQLGKKTLPLAASSGNPKSASRPL